MSYGYRRLTTARLREADRENQAAFNRWLAAQRSSQNSRQTDLPSSQLPTKRSHIMPEIPQLFVVIDTCSLITYTSEFMDYVTRLGELFNDSKCPIRFIISLPVLEELDKYNRRGPKKNKCASTSIKQDPEREETRNQRAPNDGNISPTDPNLRELLRLARGDGGQLTRSSSSASCRGPPRMFARFIEEEIRLGHRLIGELDPRKETPLAARDVDFEVINKDDRILECCVRTKAFIEAGPHHPETIVILITEDNVFKSKATTFEVASYRWAEFKLKYKNFGQNNYISTPLLPMGSFSAYTNRAARSDGLGAITTRIIRRGSIQLKIRRQLCDGIRAMQQAIPTGSSHNNQSATATTTSGSSANTNGGPGGAGSTKLGGPTATTDSQTDDDGPIIVEEIIVI